MHNFQALKEQTIQPGRSRGKANDRPSRAKKLGELDDQIFGDLFPENKLGRLKFSKRLLESRVILKFNVADRKPRGHKLLVI